MLDVWSYTVTVLPSLTICTSPRSLCSSSRRRPSADAHSRPFAPAISGLVPWPMLALSISLFVKLIRAVTPLTGAALAASCSATASGLAGGVGPLPPMAPAASAAPPARRAQAAPMTSSRRGVEMRRR